MALARWSAVLTTLDYVPFAELTNAFDRTLSQTLNRTDTAGFKIRTDHPYADAVQSLDCYLKLYRNSTLMFYGILVSSQEAVDKDGAYITASAAGPGWVFPKRYPVRAANPVTYTNQRAQIATTLMNSLNLQFPSGGAPGNPVYWYKQQGETGILAPGSTDGSTITYAVPPWKPFSEILDELHNTSDGFDWRIVARENWVGGTLEPVPGDGLKIGTFVTGDPIGATRDAAVFEFGEGHVNVKGYDRSRSRETQANVIVHLLNGQPEASPVVSSVAGFNNETDLHAGVLEDIVQADITNTTMRQNLTDAHLLLRMAPREIIEFTPMADYGDGRLPRYDVDYSIGDFVTGRAVSNGKVRFDSLFRVWGVDWSIDSNGVETPKLLLEYQAS